MSHYKTLLPDEAEFAEYIRWIFLFLFFKGYVCYSTNVLQSFRMNLSNHFYHRFPQKEYYQRYKKVVELIQGKSQRFWRQILQKEI